jgi:hypothetical protein
MFHLQATPLFQDFTLPQKRNVKAVKLKMYKHRDPTGTFKVRIKDGANVLAEKTLTSAEINSLANFTANQYQWGWFTWEFSEIINLDIETTYTIELTSDAYTFSETGYIAWIKEHYSEINKTENTTEDLEKCFSYQLWGYNEQGGIFGSLSQFL